MKVKLKINLPPGAYKNKLSGVYVITFDNGLFYVGSSSHLRQRSSNWRRALIGDNTNIQDGAIIHCTYQKAKTVIGSNVSVAHNAIVHGCTVGDNVLIGMGAIVMDDAVIGKESVIAAGAIVLPGTIVEPGSIYAGIPARKIKDIGQDMREVITRTAKNYPMYAEWYK